MSFKTIIPDRYTDETRIDRYKYINVYKVNQHYVKLLVVDKYDKKNEHTILIEKDDYEKVSEHHWGGTKGQRPPCTRIGKKSPTIGQYVGNSNLRICGKVKGKTLWDLRKNQYSETGNVYTSICKDTMKLEIYRRNGAPYLVIFDKEDYLLISKFIWRVEKDSNNTYSVVTLDNNKQLSMHCYLLKSHGQKPGNKGCRGIECKDNMFDFRKGILFKKHALNIYSFIDDDTVELTINSVHGIIKIIFDSKEYENVSGISWIYKRHGSIWTISNYKHGYLKRFIILGKTEKKFRYIIEKKDESGRFDFRKKTLLDCLK
ncbi:MAG: hypothetical protein HGB12_11170 [Bacteroidetes bacterium]|nr:hypothetical protein [Bacteroidota bacterium]